MKTRTSSRTVKRIPIGDWLAAAFIGLAISGLAPHSAEAEPAAAAPQAASPSGVPVSKPNVIVILADDLGIGDIGAYRALYRGGDERVKSWPFTPNIDRLAQQGVICTRAYSSSWCAPGRQMLLSGQWANRASAYNHPWVGNQLRQAGYVTAMVGKSHGSGPTRKAVDDEDPRTAEFDSGFFFKGGQRDFYLKAGESFPARQGFAPVAFKAKGDEHLTDVFTEQAVAFIRSSAQAGKPFFLYQPYTAPHAPLQGKPEDLRKLFPAMFDKMSDSEIRATWRSRDERLRDAHFVALVHGLDRGVGKIMEAVRESGVEDNTLIVFSSDNGGCHGSNYPLTGFKRNLLEGGIHVPFIVWSPALARAGRAGGTYDGLVSMTDIAPTLMAQATGQHSALPTDGIDLIPHLTGALPPPKDRLHFWANVPRFAGLTGAPEFEPGVESKQMEQRVLIRDDQKIIWWKLPVTQAEGAVFKSLPNAVGREEPSALLAERTPLAGQVPVEGPGKGLLEQLHKLIADSNGDLLPEWSGETGRGGKSESDEPEPGAPQKKKKGK